MKIYIVFFFLSIISLNVHGQYSPPAGSMGSTAVAKDSSALVSWATSCELKRGYLNIEDTNFSISGSNKASYGNATDAVGPAEGNSASIVSLGDGGIATLYFANGISNGQGFDFAIFENSFNDDFLELAHVEVSSDGLNFYRFPSVSLTPSVIQTGSFGSTYSDQLYNLAGSFRQGYGTPFDLAELTPDQNLDVSGIFYVRIIDAIGSIGDSATFDSQGNKINDPFPTAFESGGFDLDGVGVQYESIVFGIDELSSCLNIFPNPVKNKISIEFPVPFSFKITNQFGQTIYEGFGSNAVEIDFSNYLNGMYFVEVATEKERIVRKIIKF